MKKEFGLFLSNARKQKNLKIREVASWLSVDGSLISRFENGDRLPSLEQINKLTSVLGVSRKEIMIQWLSTQIIKEYGNYEYVQEAISVAENRIAIVQAKKAISTPLTLLNTIKEIDLLKNSLDALRDQDSFKIADALSLEYTYNSNQIEGNTLTLQETNLVVNEGITIDGKSMREHLEAINHSDAIAFVKELVNKDTAITERIILQLHNLVLRGIDKNYAGSYRNVQVMITGSANIPPAPYLIRKQMEEMMFWYDEHRLVLHPVLLAAEMHERLVSIHPFIDGNGRTSRLLMNLILLQNGYAIADIKGAVKNRMAYYDALESVRREESKHKFLGFIAETALSCMQRYLSILKG